MIEKHWLQDRNINGVRKNGRKETLGGQQGEGGKTMIKGKLMRCVEKRMTINEGSTSREDDDEDKLL